MVSQRVVRRLAGLNERRGVPTQMANITANTEAAPIAICCRKLKKKGEFISTFCGLHGSLGEITIRRVLMGWLAFPFGYQSSE